MPGDEAGTFELRVLDGATLADLQEVAVHAAATWSPRGAEVDPLDDSNLVTRGASPLTLEAQRSPRHYIAALVVASPGYALRRIEVDLASGGKLDVALERGGSLAIAVQDVPADRGVELRLHDVDGIRREIARVIDRRGPDRPRKPHEARRRDFSEKLSMLERGPDPTQPLDLAYASDLLSRSPFLTRTIRGPLTVEFDQLAPGTWAATLVSDVNEVGYCFGLAHVRVQAARKSSVELRWQSRPDPKFIRIHGVITVAPGWEQVPSEAPWIARLRREEIDATLGSDGMYAKDVESELASTADPAQFRFDFGNHPLGLYMFELPRFGMALPLLAAGEKERRLEIAPPVEVELTVRSPQGSRSVTNRHVRWAIAPAMHHARNVAVTVEPDLEDGRYRFVVPGGRVLVQASAFGDHFGGDEAAFEVSPEKRAIELRLQPQEVDLEITFRDGTRALARPWEAKLRIERDGKPISFGISFPAQGTTISPHLPGPGRYRLFVSGVEGYEDPAPIDVEVDARRGASVEIPMRRRT